MIEAFVLTLLGWLALPQVGLGAVFVISFVSATLLPLGSEPVVFATISANPALFWPVLAVATLGNTLGGALDYAMGWAALQAVHPGRAGWLSRHLERFGPKMLLLAWLPVVGDPLCTLGGWLRLPFWPSLGYMALGKFLRYLLITTLLLHVPNGFWHWLADSLS